MKKLIFVCSIGRPDVLNIVQPRLEQYAEKCNADLKIMTELPAKAMHPKFCIYYECGKPKYDKYDRMLILDDDIVINDNAPNIFDTYPDTSKYYGFDELDTVLNTFNDQIEEMMFETVDWQPFHINGGVQLSSPQHRCIYRMPPYNPIEEPNLFYWTRIVKNQPYLNFMLHKQNIDVGLLDIKWNCMCSEWNHDIIDDAHFVHLTGRKTGTRNKKKQTLYNRFILKKHEFFRRHRV